MPQAARFEHRGAMLRAEPLTDAVGPLRLVWLHGWGQSRESLRPLANAFAPHYESWLIDLPGHGESPPPPVATSPAEMAEMLGAWLNTQPPVPTVLICHSVGFRVAVHLAFSKPQAVTALVGLAGAGIPPARTLKQFLRRQIIRLLISLARRLKPFIGEGVLNALRNRFGSRDYLAAGEHMRPTFLAVVNDNVTTLCPHVPQPVLLIYGDADTETPPSVAKKFQHLFPHARRVMLPHHTHYTLLQAGRSLVEKHLRPFLQSLPKQ